MGPEDAQFSSGKYTLTRAQVAAKLGISTSSVRRMEFASLHPVMDPHGTWRFDPAELEGIEPRTPGSGPARSARQARNDREREHARKGHRAAKVFRMFARGMTLAQIVVATKQPPDVVRDLYKEWNTSLDEGEWARRDAASRVQFS